MNCHNARRLLDQGVSPGSSDAQCATLGFHLAGCAACRMYRRDMEDLRVLNALLAQPLCAPRARASAVRRRSTSRPLRVAGAALLVGGALAMLPVTGIVSTVVAETTPAVAKPNAARRGDVLLARVRTNQARVAERDDKALLQSLLDEQMTPPQDSAAYDREIWLAHSELAPGQQLTIPAMPAASADGAPEQQSTVHTVVPGDSLWAIAQKYWGDGTLWWAIYDVNRPTVGGNPNLIYPNQRLTIPAKPLQAVQQPPVATIPAGNYTIVKGDTLSHIALRRYGNANLWPDIHSKNRAAIGSNPHLIYPGTVLNLP